MGALFYAPVLTVCGVCIVLGFHRAKVVSGKSVFGVQVPVYILLTVLIGAGLYDLRVMLQSKLREANVSIADMILAKIMPTHRSWLVVTSANISFTNRINIPGFIFHIKNTGGVPARTKLRTFGRKNDPLDKDIPITAEYVEQLPQTITIGPYQETDVEELGVTPLVDPRMLELIKGYAQGTFRVDGALSYTDPTGAHGFTRFCFILVNGQSVGTCLVDNWME